MSNQETGKRTLIRCILPEDGDAKSAALYDLQQNLATIFGGFTCYHMAGGWRADGSTVIEQGHVWEVSFEPNATKEHYAIAAFTAAGQALGQTWIHIERHEFNALHVKVS